MVKRYDIYPTEMHGDASLDTWEEPKGEWVKYEDIKHLLERPRDIAQELIAGLEEVRDMRKCKKCDYPNCFCEGRAGEERATIAVPREMFQAAMCSVNRDRWTSNREGLEGSAQAMKELHDQMSDLWMASSSQPQLLPQGEKP